MKITVTADIRNVSQALVELALSLFVQDLERAGAEIAAVVKEEQEDEQQQQSSELPN